MMGSDLFALSALAKELNIALKGARIDKIQQPESDEIRLFVHSQGKNQILVMSCNAQAPRIHLTQSKKASPLQAPALCMLLRKHLINAYIDEVSVFNDDRIIRIKLSAKTEMHDDTSFNIFVEIMNRYSNIVFTDKDLVILDAVKHLPLDIARDHVVLHGVKYSPVKQQKVSYLTNPYEVYRNFDGGDLQKFTIENISGFSGITASEFLFRAKLSNSSEKLSDTQIQSIRSAFDYFIGLNEFSPCIINSKEVFPIEYGCIENYDIKKFSTMSEAYDFLYTDQDAEIRNKSRLKNVSNAAKRLVQKIEKNIINDNERLAECEDMEKYRIFGELIVNNIYKIKKGDSSLHCFDYYQNKDVEIPLNEQLSPSKNSNSYFDRYTKLKRTKEFVSKKLIADKELLDYAKSIEKEIEDLPYNADISPIEEEIYLAGGGKKQASGKKIRNQKADPPLTYLLDGFYIYRGKTNIQNDEITFKIASSDDMWLHLKNEHGAHTVIISEGREIPDKVLKFAAEITASTQQASSEVDYTKRKNVKRKPNGHPGQVIYVNYKTIVVNPDAHKEYLIRS